MRIHHDQRGQTIILVALCLPIMLGFVGMATDVGLLFKDKRTMQTAADAAAIAGALNLHYGSSAAVAAGRAASGANGFVYGSTGVTVSINVPPTWPASNYVSQTGYVEATVSKAEPTIFLALFGHSSITVAARAVATNRGPGNGCLYTLGTSGTGFQNNGNVTVTASDCGLVDNANMVLKGTADSITLNSIGVAGTYTTSGSPSVTPTPVTGIVPYSDPLAFLPQYSFSSSTSKGVTTYTASCMTGYSCTGSPISVPTTCATNGTVKGNPVYSIAAGATLSPGCYTTLQFPSGTVTLNSGLYIIDGDLSFGSGTVNSAAGGVTFYYSGAFSAGGSFNVAAPNDVTQTFNGILLAQQVGDTSDISFGGNSGSVFRGVVYAPNSDFTMKGTPGVQINAAFVVNSITLKGNPQFNSYAALPGTANPLSSIALVE